MTTPQTTLEPCPMCQHRLLSNANCIHCRVERARFRQFLRVKLARQIRHEQLHKDIALPGDQPHLWRFFPPTTNRNGHLAFEMPTDETRVFDTAR